MLLVDIMNSQAAACKEHMTKTTPTLQVMASTTSSSSSSSSHQPRVEHFVVHQRTTTCSVRNRSLSIDKSCSKKSAILLVLLLLLLLQHARGHVAGEHHEQPRCSLRLQAEQGCSKLQQSLHAMHCCADNKW
jgi:hypothetical protein